MASSAREKGDVNYDLLRDVLLIVLNNQNFNEVELETLSSSNEFLRQVVLRYKRSRDWLHLGGSGISLERYDVIVTANRNLHRQIPFTKVCFSSITFCSQESGFRAQLQRIGFSQIKQIYFRNCTFIDYTLLDMINAQVMPEVQKMKFKNCQLLIDGVDRGSVVAKVPEFQASTTLTYVCIVDEVPVPFRELTLLTGLRNLKQLVIYGKADAKADLRADFKLFKMMRQGWEEVFHLTDPVNRLHAAHSYTDPQPLDYVVHCPSKIEKSFIAKISCQPVDLDLLNNRSFALNKAQLSQLLNLELPLKYLAFNIDSPFLHPVDASELIDGISNSLKYFTIRRSPFLEFRADRQFIPKVKKENVVNLILVGNMISDFQFVFMYPNLVKLIIKTFVFEEREHYHQDIEEGPAEIKPLHIDVPGMPRPPPTDCQIVPAFVLKNLHEFYCDHPSMNIMDVNTIIRIMPQLKIIRMILNNETLGALSRGLPNLQQIVATFGSVLTSLGLRNATTSMPGLVAFAYETFCDCSGLGDECVQGGILTSPRIQHLHLSVSRLFTDAAEQALRQRVHQTTIVRNYGDHAAVRECCARKEFFNAAYSLVNTFNI